MMGKVFRLGLTARAAELPTRDYGKGIPDAKGEIKHGLEAIEVFLGGAHMVKGEFADSAVAGIVAGGLTP